VARENMPDFGIDELPESWDPAAPLLLYREDGKLALPCEPDRLERLTRLAIAEVERVKHTFKFPEESCAVP
jgi:hypothetical protein